MDAASDKEGGAFNRNLWFLSKDETPECIRSSLDLVCQAGAASSHGGGGVVQRTSSVIAMPSQSVSSEEDIRLQEMHSRERFGAIVVYSSLEELNKYTLY